MTATEKTTTVFIKNMVCDRCIMAVHKTIEEMGLKPIDVKLGSATVEGAIDDNQRQGLRKKLQSIGFELLDDQRQRTIEQIRTAIIQLVHYNDNNSPANLSSYLSEKLGQDYSALSKLFSEYASKTIERYYMEMRIERVKELLTYGELTLSQIALKLNYSSTAYLSSQFKAVTGMTPSQFKKLQGDKRRKLDEI
jgi:AraC-like DNA-binding protein